MATIQEILDKINASKSNNINNNSFIDLMRQISGNPEDAIQPVNDTKSIYGHIVQMYTTLYDSRVDYAILADDIEAIQGLYERLNTIDSLYADKTKLDSIYADKIKLDQLFADKAVIDRVYGSITNIGRVHTSIDKLDTVYASVLKMDIVADNIADVNTVADNMIVLNEIYNNRVEIYAADDNAAIATTKASEASASAATALGYKNDVSTMKLAIETIYDTFDDRFLGTKTTNPLVDNDGNSLIDGALFFDTTTNAMKVYDVGTTTWYAMPQIYLSALLDVQLTSLTTGHILVWNGTKWANGSLSKSSVGLGSVDNTADSVKNVLSATKLTTARNISLTGDVTGSVSFDGTGNVSINSTVVDDSHSHVIADVDGLQTALDNKVAKVTSTDNAIVRFNGTTGEVQNSGVVIDDGGNVGIGITPSSSGNTTHGVQTEYNYLGSMGGSGQVMFNSVPSSNSSAKYVYSGLPAVAYEQNSSGQHSWLNAPAGTAGQPITWTNAMTLGSNGNLLVGTSTDNGKHKLQVNGKIASTVIGNYSTSYQTWFDDSGVSTAVQVVPFLSASFSPMLGGATVLAGVGYTSHNIVGAWRSGSESWNTGQMGTYITPGGGSDSYSNSYYLLKDNGQIGWSGGTPTLVSLSDMRKKDKKEDLVNGLEKINTLTPFIGRYKEDVTDKDKVFLSAQEVQKILPEAVSEDIDGFLQLSYIDLVPLLISAVKDLTKEVENLKLNLGK